ncbi:hypothetical protein CR205_13320 [Alteribacter lacisalsi]|uniref:DUF1468 domain-containing protein n=1 Tax=Alteribacter lacisalsi TaxID=2045244 RepID=A0A2W0H4B7_9BACI|nr:tripartite tricarboxylate transporter TctB family protein [Alteribacter lacisalsi]PYZ96674.1 hypothetical protein CR205_13320 [Alteribacter lacisalsi]
MKGNLILSVIVIIFSLFFLYHSVNLPSSSTAIPGPGAWPTMLLIMMVILGLSLLVSTIRTARKGEVVSKEIQAEAGDEAAEEDFVPKVVFPYRYLVLLGIAVIYLFLVSGIGFLLATPLMLAGAAFLLGMRKVWSLVTTSVMGSAAVIVIFIVILNIPLPRGLGVFRELSYLIY